MIDARQNILFPEIEEDESIKRGLAFMSNCGREAARIGKDRRFDKYRNLDYTSLLRYLSGQEQFMRCEHDN